MNAEQERKRLEREILAEVPVGRRPEVLRMLAGYARVVRVEGDRRERAAFSAVLEQQIAQNKSRELTQHAFELMPESDALARARTSITETAILTARLGAARVNDVLKAIVEHCGGVEAAQQRVVREVILSGGDGEEERIRLDGDVVWIGGWKKRPLIEASDRVSEMVMMSWSERYTHAWPEGAEKPRSFRPLVNVP